MSGIAVVVRNVLHIHTGTRIAEVNIVARQKAVPLRSDIPDLEYKILGEFALNIQVVLRRILRAQVRLELSVQQQRPEALPVGILPRRRIDDAIERIWLYRAVLLQVWSVEQRSVDDVAAAEGWLSAELLEHQLLHRVVEQAPTRADAGLAAGSRTPGQA